MILLASAVQFMDFGLQTLTFFNLYTFVLIAGVSVYLIFIHQDAESVDAPFLTTRDYFIISLFFTIQLLIRLYGIERFSLWLDEIAQLQLSLKAPFIDASAIHFQPPLDYILQKFMVVTFGFTDFVIRLNAVVFSVVASTLFFALLKRISGSYIMSLVLCTLMIFEPWFFKYSFDARPMALGYLSLVVFMITFINLLKPKAEGLKKSDSILLFCTSVLFTMALGYQPVAILSAIIAALGCCRFFSKNENKYYFQKLIYPIAAALVFFIPIQIKIYLDSLHTVSPSFGNMLNKISNFELNNFTGLYQVYTVYFILLFTLLSLLILLNKFLKKSKIDTFEANFFISIGLMFFIASSFVFSALLNFRLAPHYVIFILPLIFISSAYLYKACVDCFNVVQHKNYFKLVCLFGAFLALPQFNLSFVQNPTGPMRREDIKNAFAKVLNESTDDDYLMTMSFPAKSWTPIENNIGIGPYYVSKSVRDRSKGHASAERGRQIPILAFYSLLKKATQISNLYVLINRGYEQVYIDFDALKKLKNVEVTYFENVVLIKVKNESGDLQKEWFEVVDKLQDSS
ncbi:MAG: hypothetical protein ABL930_12470, partial [Pseudobdellovibrio sp.]